MSRQADVQAASSVGKNAIHLAHQQSGFCPPKQLHFRSLPDNTVVYSNLLINIPQGGIRPHMYARAHHELPRANAVSFVTVNRAIFGRYIIFFFDQKVDKCDAAAIVG